MVGGGLWASLVGWWWLVVARWWELAAGGLWRGAGAGCGLLSWAPGVGGARTGWWFRVTGTGLWGPGSGRLELGAGSLLLALKGDMGVGSYPERFAKE
jgi:hypothetical protein